MALEHNGKIIMNKKMKFGFLIIGGMLLVAIIFATCSGNDSDKKSTNKDKIVSPFDAPKIKPKTDQFETKDTRPDSTPDLSKNALLDLPISGVVDFYYPETYLSPRYDAIVYGSFEGSDDLESNYLRDAIAITELNDPSNSDLDPVTFNTLRDLVIDVAKAEQTSVGVSKYPRYFTKFSTPDTCVDFKTNAAGVISMPYPGDSSWYLGVINWSAKCFPFGADKEPKVTTLQQTIYLQKVGNTYVPVTLLDIPRKSLDEFAQQ